ncbi:DUF6549 family protein [uncultured Rikenella sp.]|uniref:DUF6549 family protein n=1 Tax=uncultured Rikenella sp. TaxID=368003 RepID=UPI0025DB9B27|nr:DUF6549 family protein [uncultured Rikenella sp.]
MKKYLNIAAAILAAVLILAVLIQHNTIRRVKADRNVYKSNTEALLSENEHYKTKDSLNAVSTRAIELKLEEFERYRAEDAKLISTLRADKKRLESIATAQTETIYALRSTVRDSIVYIKGKPNTIRCVDYHDTWLDFSGCFSGENLFEGTIRSRDSLLYVEHVVPKRFLGFLWKTKRVKERRQEIVSRNPHTEIIGAEFITIRK